MSENIQELLSMYTYRRPHLGATVDLYVKDFILPIGATLCDKSGNYTLDVVDTQGSDIVTLFSSHVDTVHRDDGFQKIIYQPDFGHVSKDDGKPLGSDDATGVWLMLQMIREGIAGRYVFHVGEEKGGIGSSDLVELAPHHLDGILHAVAFDRRGTTDVITHQAGGRCCSDAFADELASQLGLGYKANDGGVFTDTANFTENVKECTNLSVGYDAEHTGNETQDIFHLENMLEKLLQVDWSGLPAERDETVVDSWYSGRGGNWGGGGYYGSGYKTSRAKAPANSRNHYDGLDDFGLTDTRLDSQFLTTYMPGDDDDLLSEATLKSLCTYDTELMAYILYNWMYLTPDDINEALEKMNERDSDALAASANAI